MCIALPSRILEIFDAGLPMARVLVPGRPEDPERIDECCLAYVPEARVGDHVLVSNGFAVDLLDEKSARESLAAFAEVGLLPGSPTET
ncbi:HypC/HybG/HupF family hydrogenase formation chaperone [Luteococcus sp. OSA5]|uniref:HypC/HybG/HupF family hydrogenase formation chaperone n=1 Tax=Luteococcus sp. OSA5 TaxID=3401630 RepID=UPI003B42C998